MGIVYTNSENYSNIADAMREKNGSEAGYTPLQMPAAIRAIVTDPEIEPLSVAQNGTYTAPEGVDGFSPVTVNVSGGSSGTPRLPAGYQEVEYIRGTKTQWINTGVTQNTCCGIQAKVSFYDIDAMDGCGIAGTNVNNGYASYAHYYHGYNYGIHLYVPSNTMGVANSYSPESLNEDTFYFISCYLKNRGNYYGFGVNNKYCAQWTKTFTLPSENIGIFGLTEAGNAQPVFIGGFDLYAMTLFGTTDGVPVRDYIPCCRESDNEVGLYDLVTERFYANAGTGSFTKGPNISGTISSLEITENGTYTAENNVMGYSPITVNVGGTEGPSGLRYGSATKSDDIISGFNSTGSYVVPLVNWAQADFNWSQPFEIGVIFKCSAFKSNGGSALFGCSTSGQFYRCPSVEVSRTGFWCGLSANGSTWTYNNGYSDTIDANTWYYFYYKWDGSNFAIGYTKDYTTYKENSISANTPYHNSSYKLCFGGTAQASHTYAQYVSMSLRGTYVKVNGELKWGSTYLEDNHLMPS